MTDGHRLYKLNISASESHCFHGINNTARRLIKCICWIHPSCFCCSCRCYSWVQCHIQFKSANKKHWESNNNSAQVWTKSEQAWMFVASSLSAAGYVKLWAQYMLRSEPCMLSCNMYLWFCHSIHFARPIFWITREASENVCPSSATLQSCLTRKMLKLAFD